MSPVAESLTLRLAVASGLERAAEAEARRLVSSRSRRGRGHVRLETGPVDAARLVATARVPARIELVLREELPAEPGALARALGDAPWDAWIPPGAAWTVRVVGSSGPLRDPPTVVRLVRDAVATHGRVPPPVRAADARVTVAVRLARSGTAVGIDLAGGSLHRRAGATRTKAPLREDLAAGVAWLARVRADRPLVDPFCGSGVLIAEAAGIATGQPPNRPLGALPLFDLAQFKAVDRAAVAAWRNGLRRAPAAPFIAGDSDAGAVAAARATLAACGLAGAVTVTQCAADALVENGVPGVPGLLLTNPPWGRRHAGGVDAAWESLFRLLGRLGGWRAAILASEDAPAEGLPLAIEARHRLRVGTVDAVLHVGRVR